MDKSENIISYIFLLLGGMFCGSVLGINVQMYCIINDKGFTWDEKQYQLVVVSEKRWITTQEIPTVWENN